MKHFFVLIVGGVLGMAPLTAQYVLTLEECMEFALKNNLQLKQSELNVERSMYNKERAVADFLPTVNTGASLGRNYGQRIDPFTNQFATNSVASANLFGSTSLTIFSGLTKVNTLKQSRYAWLASIKDVDGVQNSLRLNLTMAYLNVLFARELLFIADNQLEITRQQVDRTRSLVDAGQLPRASLLDLESQMASEELNVVNAQNDLTIAKVTLVQTLQIEDISVDDFDVAAPAVDEMTPTPLVISSDEVFNAALSLMPEVQAAEYRIASAQSGLAAARGRHSPTLSFGAQIGTGYSELNVLRDQIGTAQIPFGFVEGTGQQVFVEQPILMDLGPRPYQDQFRDNFNRNIAVNLTIPIFNGWQVRTGVQQARIDLESAQLALEERRNDLYQDIRRAHADASAAYKQFLASNKAVEALSENFNYAEARFQQKAINAVEYFDIKTRLTNAESNLAQAKFNYLFRTKILDFYQGKPISLD